MLRIQTFIIVYMIIRLVNFALHFAYIWGGTNANGILYFNGSLTDLVCQISFLPYMFCS